MSRDDVVEALLERLGPKLVRELGERMCTMRRADVCALILRHADGRAEASVEHRAKMAAMLRAWGSGVAHLAEILDVEAVRTIPCLVLLWRDDSELVNAGVVHLDLMSFAA